MSLYKSLNPLKENFNKIFKSLKELEKIKKGTFKVYSIKLTQEGVSAPTSIVLNNTMEGEIVISRESAGVYHITSVDSEFTQEKTSPEVIESTIKENGDKITAEWKSVSVIEIKTYLSTDTSTLADGVLTKQLIYLEIYN